MWPKHVFSFYRSFNFILDTDSSLGALYFKCVKLYSRRALLPAAALLHNHVLVLFVNDVIAGVYV